MSINIQLDGKLQKISGQTMSKDKIVEKLGYTPANKATVDANIAELNSNLNILDGALVDHKNNMSDIDAGSADDEFIIADSSGYVITKFDDEGIHTTGIEAESFTSNDKELAVYDDNGNAAFKVDENGITHAAKLELNSGDIDEQLGGLDAKIGGVGADLAEHAAADNNNDSTDPIHLQPGERATWNAKATTKYVDDAVAGIVNSAPETLNTLNELATALGNDKNFATTVTNELAKKATQADFAEHKADSVSHITAAERSTWDNKSDVKSYNDLPDAPNIAPEDNEDSLVITDNAGNIVLKAGELDEDTTGLETTTVIADEVKANTAVIGNIYNKTEVDAAITEHKNDIIAHTKAQVGLGNVDNTSDADKPVSTATKEALDSLKSELSEQIVSESNAWQIVDDDGNVVLRAGELDDGTTGLETTTIRARVAAIDNVYTKTEIDAAIANAGYAITANADDDDVVILEGTSGTNSVTYKATHASSGVTAGTYKSVTVDAKGHVTAGSNPTTIAGFEITDAYTKTEVDAKDTAHATAANAHTKSQVGLGNVDNTSDIDKPVSTATQTALDNLKTELSESITSESDSWTIVDESGNIVLKAGMLDNEKTGLETTTVVSNNIEAKTAAIGNIYTKTEVDAKIAEHAEAESAHTKAQVGLGNVDNTSDADKPVSTATQNALDALKNELSESITSESNSWTIVDEAGNIVLKAGELDEKTTGLETTTVIAEEAKISNLYTKLEVDAIIAEIEAIPNSSIEQLCNEIFTEEEE
jgi:hypothetical protein